MSENHLGADNSGLDIFVGELTRVERIGTNRRLIFTMPDPLSPNWRVIVAKLIVPAEAMVALAYMIAGDGVKPVIAAELLAAMPAGGAAN